MLIPNFEGGKSPLSSESCETRGNVGGQSQVILTENMSLGGFRGC